MPHVLHLSFKMTPLKDWKLPGESTTKQNVNIVLPSKHAISNAMQDVTILHLRGQVNFFFKNSEARGKNTLHLIDDTTKKSGTKTFDAKSVMITNAVQVDPRKDQGKKQMIRPKKVILWDLQKTFHKKVLIVLNKEYDFQNCSFD